MKYPLSSFKFAVALLVGSALVATESFADDAAAPNYSGLLINVAGRDALNLSGPWRYIADPLKQGELRAESRRLAVFGDITEPRDREDLIEYNFDTSPMMEVPGDWNGQDATLDWFDGLVWFRRTLNLDRLRDGRTLLHVGAANYRALVYVNGEKVGEHEGGFTPFAFDVTDVLRAGDNSIVIGVDSELDAQSLPTPIVDWKNYGGITRDVHLVHVPDTYVSTYFVRLGPEGRLRADVTLAGAAVAGGEVRVEIPQLGVVLDGQTDAAGVARLDIAAPAGLERWHPDHPRLYDVTVSGPYDTVSDRIGFRTLEVRDGDILLNGERLFLRGISLHEETLGATPSRAMNRARARALLTIARDDLKANFVRLAHYPHAEVTTRLADELGLLVWSEIPVYWEIDFGNADTLRLARQMQRDNILRDRNRVSIALWSIANETPQTDARLAFLGTLADDARALDGTRLVTAALHNVKSEGRVYTVDDPLADIVDVVAVNTYQGWYGNMRLEDVPSIEWRNPTGKPFLFSEFGAGALYGFRDRNLEKFSEDFQAEYYRATIAMAQKVEGLDGVSPWILKDFKSPRRLHGRFQQYWNRKGIMSPEGRRKLAFQVLGDWYRDMARPGARADAP